MNRGERTLWRKHVMSCGDLKPTHRLVLLALETFANYSDGTGARPGVALLAAKSGLAERTVQYALESGRIVGLIQRTARGARKQKSP